jgi:hypothetical protein
VNRSTKIEVYLHMTYLLVFKVIGIMNKGRGLLKHNTSFVTFFFFLKKYIFCIWEFLKLSFNGSSGIVVSTKFVDISNVSFSKSNFFA